MKNLRTLLASAVFATAISIGAIASAQDMPGFATVVRVQGVVSYSLGDGNWHPLVAGRCLTAGSTIRTGENGIVDVVLGKQIAFPQAQAGATLRISQASDAPVRGLIGSKPSEVQNAVRLTPGTTLAIDKLNISDTGADTVSDTELNLQQGRIFASVRKLNSTSQYLVKIPNGIAGVRGTEFSVDADGAVACFESSSGNGLVLSLTIGGVTTTYVVAAGQMLEPAGGANNQPVPISPGLENVLSGIFTALKTTYNVVVNFDYNNNNLYISSVTGNFGQKTTVTKTE
jgi:hypothetical protein